MKTYEKPEIKIQTLTTSERLMKTKCEDKELVPKFKPGSIEIGTYIVCTYTLNDC